MISFEISIAVSNEEEETMQQSEYSNSVAFEDAPDAETISNLMFGMFGDLFKKAAIEYGLFKNQQIMFEDDTEDEDNTDASE